MGSRLRVEWEFRLCSAWPEPKILLLIKLSRASVSAQAPRDGSQGCRGCPRLCHDAHGSCKSPLVADLQEFYRELKKDLGVPAWPLQGNKSPLLCAANLVMLKGSTCTGNERRIGRVGMGLG